MGAITSSIYDIIYYSSPDFEEFYNTEKHHYVVREDSKTCFGFESCDNKYIAGVFKDNRVINGVICDEEKAIIYVKGRKKLTYLREPEKRDPPKETTVYDSYTGC